MKLILAEVLKLTGIGLAITLPFSFAISKDLASLIFGVVSVDFTIVAAD